MERHPLGHSEPAGTDDSSDVRPVAVAVALSRLVGPRIEGRECATTEFDVRRSDSGVYHVDMDTGAFG